MAGRPTFGTLLSSQSSEESESLGTRKKALLWEIFTAQPHLTRWAGLGMASKPVLAWRVAQPECQLLKPGPQANGSQIESVAKPRPDKLEPFPSPVSRKKVSRIMDSNPVLWNCKGQRRAIAVRRERSQLSLSSV